MPYEPPFESTDAILSLAIQIGEMAGTLSPSSESTSNPTLHRKLRIQTIHSSLAIEQNGLSLDQVTAIIDGKRVLGPPDEIREVENAKRAYDLMEELDPYSMNDLLRVHRVMMDGLAKDAGRLRTKNAGVYDGERLIHAGTPAAYVPEVMADLFAWLKRTRMHPLVASCVFHYEFEFVHPFSDGNGRTGRLWHTLLLASWRPALAWLPVENVIQQRQAAYYAAINASNTAGSSTEFVQFMLEAIRDALVPYCTGESPSATAKRSALKLMRERPETTVSELAEALGISKRTTERLVSELKREGEIRRVGSPRKGRWEVVAP